MEFGDRTVLMSLIGRYSHLPPPPQEASSEPGPSSNHSEALGAMIASRESEERSLMMAIIEALDAGADPTVTTRVSAYRCRFFYFDFILLDITF